MQWDRTARRLYPIVDSTACEARGLDPRDVAEACFKGGARIAQVRVKTASSAGFIAIVDSIVAAAKPFAATVIVNDRTDIALISGADGVHVGQDDLPPAAVRELFPNAVIGLSTHDERQVDDAARSTADYVAVGPIFATETKATGYDARGLDLVRYAAASGKPVVAIGGITFENARAVIESGASAVAVISDLLIGDTEARVRHYVRTLAEP